MNQVIRQARETDAEVIADIYNFYIKNTAATFEESPVSEEEIKNRITQVQHSGLPWLVAEQGGKVIGYTYATKWKERSAYRFSVEVTVYLAPEMNTRGWGTHLYQALFASLREKSVHSVIGGIVLPNPASVSLHEKMGMKKVAHFEQVGFKFGQWLDVGYWQVNLKSVL